MEANKRATKLKEEETDKKRKILEGEKEEMQERLQSLTKVCEVITAQPPMTCGNVRGTLSHYLYLPVYPVRPSLQFYKNYLNLSKTFV